MIERTLQKLPNMSAGERERLRDNAERLRATGTPQQRADAIRILDAMAALIEAERRSMMVRLSGMDVAQRVAEAFRAVPMSDTERRVVQVLLDHPGSTSTELSRALAWGGQSWHLHFGEMCQKREAYLWPANRSEKRDDADFYSGILADLAVPENRWTMKPEAVAAFSAVGISGRGN